MLFMQFKVNDNRYLLDVKNVVEIIPFANLKRILKSSAYVAGLLNYRGDAVPVIDVCYLMSNKPCEPKLSSRIAMVNYKDDNHSVCIGLLIEHLTETVRYNEDDFSDPGIILKESPYLGRGYVDCTVNFSSMRENPIF